MIYAVLIVVFDRIIVGFGVVIIVRVSNSDLSPLVFGQFLHFGFDFGLAKGLLQIGDFFKNDIEVFPYSFSVPAKDLCRSAYIALFLNINTHNF